MRFTAGFLTIIGVSALLASCAAQLTQGGRMVRQIQPDWSTRCKFLGVVEGSEGGGWDTADDQTGALNTVRNTVAEMQGNAYVLNQSATSDLRTVVQADAYSCPE